MQLKYIKATKQDAEVLVSIYNAAFYEDYIRYGECPAYGRTKKLMEISVEVFPKYIIYADERPVGVISFENKGAGKYYIGCLCIVPKYQDQGIGTQAFKYMMSVCSDWQEITLITPADKKKNIKFYTQKCGFSIGAKAMDGDVEVVKFYMKR